MRSPSSGGQVSKHKRILTAISIIILLLACGCSREVEQIPAPQSSGSGTTPSPQEGSLPTDQSDPYSEIQVLLRAYPPCLGNEEVRRDAILTLDEFLKDDSLNIDLEIAELYHNMMGFVESEINDPVTTGVRIWSMYNHGFIVKTPSTTFAFDLVNGYPLWKYQLPDSILGQIQVLFLSHKHEDHRDPAIIKRITELGGQVVVPKEDMIVGYDTIGLSPGDEVTIAGLHVKAYDGLHGPIPVRIYEITTPEGITLMHTGDNQTSETLPDGVTVDILLLNAWVNEDGSTPAIVGMRNSINKLAPGLTIPGHIQERSHGYDPSNSMGRVPFEWPLAVDDGSIPGKVSVQIWGEHCDFPIE